MRNSGLYVARRESKMRQKDVAKAISIHEQSYHLKESGQRDFKQTEMTRLAILFNKSLDELFMGGQNK